MHKAFWDALREKLSDDPPDYSFALQLIAEVKQVNLILLKWVVITIILLFYQ